jgi:oligosaccharide repeat unit polymerase
MNNRINSSTFYKYLVVIIAIVSTGAVLLMSESIVIDIVSLTVLSAVAVAVVKADPVHPYTWFSVFFLLYSISYPYLILIGSPPIETNAYNYDLMITQWLALSTFLLIVSPVKIERSSFKQINYRKYSIGLSANLFAVFAGLSLLVVIGISLIDFQRKDELYESGALVAVIGTRVITVLLILFTVLTAYHILSKGRFSYIIAAVTFFLTLGMFLVSGERNTILSFILCVFYLYYVLLHKDRHNVFLYLGAPLLLYLPTLFNTFKYFGVTGEVKETSGSVVVDIFSAEFAAASRNLQIILAGTDTAGVFSGYTILAAAARAFQLPFMPEFLSILQFRPQVWFNEVLIPDREGGGLGFTLVGEGYINFGYAGIVILFLIVGGLAKILYFRSNRGLYYLSFYILAIPLFIYSIRGGLATLFSPLVGQILLGIVTIFLLEYFISRLSQKNNYHYVKDWSKHEQ